MEKYNKYIGDMGESFATEYLRQNGYTVLERNYRTKAGEIDIIARVEKTVVFVEVKTRSSEKYGSPSEAVDFRKRKHIADVAEEYYSANLFDDEIRFDIIEVIVKSVSDGSVALQKLNHIEGIIID